MSDERSHQAFTIQSYYFKQTGNHASSTGAPHTNVELRIKTCSVESSDEMIVDVSFRQQPIKEHSKTTYFEDLDSVGIKKGVLVIPQSLSALPAWLAILNSVKVSENYQVTFSPDKNAGGIMPISTPWIEVD